MSSTHEDINILYDLEITAHFDMAHRCFKVATSQPFDEKEFGDLKLELCTKHEKVDAMRTINGRQRFRSKFEEKFEDYFVISHHIRPLVNQTEDKAKRKLFFLLKLLNEHIASGHRCAPWRKQVFFADGQTRTAAQIVL